MLEEKAQALQQIEDIKKHLVDKQTFFPYNYQATYAWALIALILTVIMVPMYESSIFLGTAVTFVFIAIGFLTEGFLTIKVNKSYDIDDCTQKQRFIMKNFLILSIFGIVLSMVLASYTLYVPIFLLWLFLCSVGYFAVGYILNIERFSQMAWFNILSSTLLLVIAYLLDDLEGKGDYLGVVQFFVILGLSVMPSIVAWQQIREEEGY